MKMKMKINSRITVFFTLALLVPILVNIAIAGNKELMEKKKAKTLLLNEKVIEQIDELKEDTVISFVGRVVKNKNGDLEIRVEHLVKKTPMQETVANSGGRYIQYMSFEEMQQLPEVTNRQTQQISGGAAASR